MDEKVIVAWNCIKSLEHYPITCSTNEEQDEFKKIPFNELFKDQIKIIDNHIDLTNEIINKASDDIQTIIDLLNSKIVTMGHIDVAIKKLEIIQDKLMGIIYLNKPYKFEDLKPNMWVWDNVAKECLYVVRPFITTGVRVKYFTCLGICNLEKITLKIEFEENRFFPVQYANQFL